MVQFTLRHEFVLDSEERGSIEAAHLPTDELCPLAFVLDTDPKTAVEWIATPKQALVVAMSMMRGPGSLVQPTEQSSRCVVDFPLDEEFDVLDDEFIVEEEGSPHLRVMLGDTDSSLRQSMITHLVTRFIANFDHLVAEHILVVPRADDTGVVQTPREMGDHVLVHLKDFMKQNGIDPSSDVVTVSTDRVVDMGGTSFNPIVIERVFDNRVSSSLNMLGVRLDRTTPPRHSTAHVVSETD